MSRFVRVAAAEFITSAERYSPDARNIILGETRKCLDSVSGFGYDLVVLSEGIEALGVGMDQAEELASPGEFLTMYSDFAKAESCNVAGSAKIHEDGKIYNSIVFVNRDGGFAGVYHKANLTLGEIDEGLCSGPGATVVDTDVGRLGGAICFDLNFDSLRDQYRELCPDILIFSSMYHGGFKQTQWAYDSRAFFVCALPFEGSGIRDPHGVPVATTDHYTRVASATINLDYELIHLDYNRDKFDDIRREYSDEITLDIPRDIGSAILYSNSDKRSAADIVDEYDLMRLDDYFEEAVRRNNDNRV